MSNSESITYDPESFLSFLNNESYQTYNRNIAKQLRSVNAAIMLSELIQRYQNHKKQKELINHETYGEAWFFYTHETGEERTCLSRFEQDNGIKKLEEAGYIQKITFGLPARRHFRILSKNIMESLLFSKKHSSLRESDKLDCEKVTNQIDENSQTHIYKNSIEELYVKNNNNNNQKEEVVVVFSCLQERNDLSPEDKATLMKFPEERVKLALNFSKKEPFKKSLIQQLIWHCKEDIPPKPNGKKSSEEENKKFAQEKEKKFISSMAYLNVLSSHCEFVAKKGGVVSLDYKSDVFKEKFEYYYNNYQHK